MKKLIYCAAALAAMIFAGSCQQENLEPVAQENTVTYTVELPGVETKAIADGSNVNRLYYEVWKIDAEDATDVTTDLTKDGVATRLYQNDIAMTSENGGPAKTVVTLNLVQDQEYTILFWAQNNNALGNGPAYNTANLTAVTYVDAILNDKITPANNESLAAFYAVDFVSEGDPKSKTIYLKRPFAQLNIGTLNTVDANEYAIAMQTSQVTVSSVPTVFNVATSVATAEVEDFVFDTALVPNNPEHPEYATNSMLQANGVTYQYAAMNYIFANYANAEGQSPATVEVDFNIDVMLSATDDATPTTTPATINHKVPNVPLSQNYRTNIVGNLLTSETEYNVIVDPNWADGNAPDGGYIYDVWNGTEIREPKMNGNIYEISSASELAWLAAAVNGTLPDETKASPAPNTFAGKTFKLIADIDLAGEPWQPIGYWETFDGKFDGGDHIINNLNVTVTEPDAYLGLFGCTNNATIKNLKVYNATIKSVADDSWAGGQLGVIVGYPDGETVIENITLTGNIKVEGPTNKKGSQRIGAIAGGYKGTSMTLKNITINANEGSYVKGNLYVGGVIGAPFGVVNMTDVTSNIYVEAREGIVGGIAGCVAANSTLKNCTSTGDVKRVITTGTEIQKNRIGGIIGAWGCGSGTITLENCNYEGTLYRGLSKIAYPTYAGYAGAAYYEKEPGTGIIVINGDTYQTEYSATDEDGNIYVYSAEGLQYALNNTIKGENNIFFCADIVGDVTICQKVENNIVIDGQEKKYDGTIYLEGGNQGGSSPETLLFKNINFEHLNGTIDFISADDRNVGKRYAHNVTVEDCTFTGNSYGDVVPMRYRQTFNMTVKNCTADNVHSFMWATGGKLGIKITEVESNGKNGVSFGTTENVIVEDSKFITTEAFGYGVRVDGSGAYSAHIKNTEITAGAPVLMRNTTGAYKMNLEGATLNTTEVYQVIVASNDYEAGEALKAPATTYDLNTNGAEYVVFSEQTDLLMASSAETLKAAIAAANNEKFTEIKLANGTYTGAFDIDAKSVKISAINKHKATIDGLVHGLNFAHVTLKDLVLTNATPAASASARHNADYYCLGSYVTDWLIEDCIFNVNNQGQAAGKGAINIYANRDDYELYDDFDLTVKNTVFNCNGERPIRGKTNSWVEGCRFVDQHRYAIQVQGNSGLASETVKFVNNEIVDPCKTSGEAYVASVSISKSQLIEDAAFIIKGNTDAKFVYDNNDNVKITTCTLNGTLIAAGQCVSIPGVSDAKEVIFEYEEGTTLTATSEDLTAALNGLAKNIVLLPGTYEGAFAIKADGTTITGTEGAVMSAINLNGKDNVTIKDVEFDAAKAIPCVDGNGAYKVYANIMTGVWQETQSTKGAHNVVIEGCSFTGSFKTGKPGSAIAFTDYKRTSGYSGNITIKKCTFDTVVDAGGYDIYGYYVGDESNGHGDFVIENNTFKSSRVGGGGTIALYSYCSNTPIVVKDNDFEKDASLDDAIYVSTQSYTVSVDASNNTFAN